MRIGKHKSGKRDGRPYGYTEGDHLMVCDQTGLTRLSRDIVRQWDGLLVWKEQEDPRHPQEYVRGVPDDYAVRNPRPRGPLESTLTTGNSATTTVEVPIISTRGGDDLQTRGGDDIIPRFYIEEQDIIVVDLGDEFEISRVVMNLQINQGQDTLNMEYSTDNVTYTSILPNELEVLRDLESGTTIAIVLGSVNARYIRLRVGSFLAEGAFTYNLSRFDVLGVV